MKFSLSGRLVDLENQSIYSATIDVENGRIARIQKTDSGPKNFILPGMIDAHVHVESSMLIPSEFARLAVVHGTVGTVSDPHEIANVLGVPGVEFMIENGKTVPFKFFFGAPSCVPATSFETAGAVVDVSDIELLMARADIFYLSEMMNFPGVLHEDPMVMAKLAAAKKAGKPIDGHAPGLRGALAERYASHGITTDHECFTLEEAQDKLAAGMHIIIREGSAAKNFEALWPIFKTHPDRVMLCSDDKHPNDLLRGHINQLVARAIAKGIDPLHALRAASLNPVLHYRLPVGRLREGDPADFIVAESLETMQIQATYIDGHLVAEHGASKINHQSCTPMNYFNLDPLPPAAIRCEGTHAKVRVIEVYDGQLITGEISADVVLRDGVLEANPAADILKMVVVNRYTPAPPAIAFVKNFGLKAGAIASSVAHDSHNVIAVGVNDEEIVRAINLLGAAKGGISVVDDANSEVLPLPVAGLMSLDAGEKAAEQYEAIDARAKELGTPLSAPFMTLSFLALLVIPKLKLSDKGLFNGERFEFVPLSIA